MNEYKLELIKKAEVLITRGFPEKIVELNELLSTKDFADRDFHDVYQVCADEDYPDVCLESNMIIFLVF